MLSEELPELKSIRAVQDLVARIPMQPRPLFINENDACLQWLNTHCSKSAYGAESQLGKDAFAVLIDGVGKYLLKREEIAFQECDKIGPMENDDLDCAKADAFVEAVKMKLSRHMCKQLEACFELLDKDKDVCFRDVEKLLQVVVHGNGTRWLKGKFWPDDGEDVVNEAESRLILNSIIATQKAVMAEVFATHVDYMPKKSEKLFAKSLSEEDYRLKIPEKVRCVYHFANKVCKTNDWKLFLNSQES
ncbi:hypothetical protein CCR75_005446 [Bremia lactucae]|uniref:Uncharacterized protein n=1 Tax=Bremia lactucae TaxID=4779 RepID=A0A976IEN6_BRELC|nr:hypothetical protein CCR75_005446 [Bremia lactucae]